MQIYIFISQMQETSVGHVLDEDGIGGPYTVFVPSDEALNNMKDGTLDYLLSSEVLYPTDSNDVMSGSLLQSLSIQAFSKSRMTNK